jgi:thiamine biosynthesis lipoprotein
MARTWSLGLLAIFAPLAAFSRQLPADDTKLLRFTFQEPHMGTLFRIVLYAPDEASAKKAARAAFDRVAELNKIMSDYLADSELMQLCKKAGGPPTAVSDDLFKVLRQAQDIARDTGGAFDVSVSPLVRLWRTARKTRSLPDPDALKKALERVDYRKIKLDAERRTVQLLIVGMLLDLGGIAKGYAADAALEVLRRHGFTRALVAAGGDVRAGEPPPDAKGWKVGVTPLRDPNGEPSHYLLIAGAAVSTSGDAHQNLEIGGKRYSHIVDPKTGIGLPGRRAVTVVAPDGALADALATAVCVLGAEKGLQLVENRSSCAAMFVCEADGVVHATSSSRFAKYLIE